MNWNVYLSGAIAGLNYDQIMQWRTDLRPLVDSNIRLISPMRGKEHLKDNKKFHKLIADNDPTSDVMANAKSIFSRDYFDVQNCDVLLFNSIGTKITSIGSVCEVAWAFQMKKQIIFMIDQNKKNPHNHDFIHQMANYTVHSLEDAAFVINKLFVGYRK